VRGWRLIVCGRPALHFPFENLRKHGTSTVSLPKTKMGGGIQVRPIDF
jgi:hypothetical protein